MQDAYLIPVRIRHAELLVSVVPNGKLVETVEASPEALISTIIARQRRGRTRSIRMIVQHLHSPFKLSSRWLQAKQSRCHSARFAPAPLKVSYRRVPYGSGSRGEGEIIDVVDERHVIVKHPYLVKLCQCQRTNLGERHQMKLACPSWGQHRDPLRYVRAECSQLSLTLLVAVWADDDMNGQPCANPPRRFEEPFYPSELTIVSCMRPMRISRSYEGRVVCKEEHNRSPGRQLGRHGLKTTIHIAQSGALAAPTCRAPAAACAAIGSHVAASAMLESRGGKAVTRRRVCCRLGMNGGKASQGKHRALRCGDRCSGEAALGGWRRKARESKSELVNES